MEDKLLRKDKMYITVGSVLRKNEPVWGSSVFFKEEVLTFEEYLEQINKINPEQASSKSASEAKKQVAKKMLESALLICSAGAVFAEKKNDKSLKTTFNYSKSTLKDGNEKDVLARCIQIGKAAVPIMADLVLLNLPADEPETLAKNAASFEKQIAVPHEVIITSKNTRKEMYLIFDKADTLLKERLDKMVMMYKNSHPEFHNAYINARIIGGWAKKKDDGTLETNHEPDAQ